MFRILNLNILEGFQKNEYILGYEDFVDIIFGGSSQNWTGFGGHFYAIYGLFLRSMYRMGIYFVVAKISIIFLGRPDILNNFGVLQ